ncbi:methyl-accepting chemotaxis protein [Moritella viscosa]|nr:methyl-accepting chemotaxis protein [Moritella viscosa]CED59088.1 methyl-accepting chemotaxis protein [Moritella viscosa]SGZ07315.1 Hypothetical methyl-accepting chemotaxis protein [Moritella viscosa]SHO28429.1 Hypothetical methyl-accepting chemotaxis protein [Moritella viscosa]
MIKLNTLKRRFAALSGIVVILMIINGAFPASKLNNIENSWHAYHHNVVKRQELLMEIKENFGYGGLIHNFKNYVLRATPKYATRVSQRYLAVSQRIAEYRTIPSLSKEERKALDNIEAVANKYRNMLEVIIPMVEGGKSITSIDSIVKIDDAPALTAFDILNGHYHDLSSSTIENMESDIAMAKRVVIGTVFLITVLLTIGNFHMYRLTVVRIIQLKNAIVRSNNNRDLSVRSSIKGSDEITDTAEAFNELMSATQQAITLFSASADEVAVAATQLSTLSINTNQLMEQQQNETEQVATAMNEMSATVQDVVNNISNAANSAREANDIASNAGGVVSESIVGIGSLADQIGYTAGVITQLENETTEISVILDDICGIADQTNLLALNAAIEAARAGEQGRGFAVVADEVRNLAQRTQGATEKIQKLIIRLQNGAKDSVQAMDSGKNQSLVCVNQAGETGSAFDNIIRTIGNISDMTQQIASASEEQSVATEEMNRNIINIHQASEKTSSSSNEIEQSCQRLATLSSELKETVNKFQV